MKKYLLMMMLAIASMTAKAQSEAGTWSIIPRLGVSLANLTDNKYVIDDAGEKINSNYKAGMSAGADVEYQLTDMWSLSLGGYYSMQGNRYPDCETYKSKTYEGLKQHYVNLQYINVPLMVNCYVAEGLALKAGVQLGALLDAREKYKATAITKNQDLSNTYGDRKNVTVKRNDECNKTDFSIPVGVSYEYMNVILDARYNFGLANVYKADGVKSKNRFGTVTIGYRFKL